jgi:transmembrane sensor
MPNTQRTTPYNEQIRDEATEWFVRFCEEELDSTARAEFDHWLRISPEHVRAYLEISAFWEAAGSMKRVCNVDLEALIERARSSSNVVQLEPPKPAVPQAQAAPPAHRNLFGRLFPGKAFSLSRRSLAVAASVVLCAVVLVAAVQWELVHSHVYVAQTGERRTIALEDGSTIKLNSRTRIRVRFSAHERSVELTQGQALFRVAKDPARAFIVEIGGTRVRAIGTQFDVYRKAKGTVVTVVEGRVAVSAAPEADAPEAASGNGPPALLLLAGQQAWVAPHAAPTPRQADPAAATAWTEGRLVFDATPLAEVVQEFNRYNTRQLSIDDPGLLGLHISGTFGTRDSAQMVRFLSQRFGLVAHDTDTGVRLSRE